MTFNWIGIFQVAIGVIGLLLAVAFAWLLITERHNRRNPPDDRE